MLKNENIICISSIDWDFIWQGHQEIMSRLAEKGNRVLFIENTGVRAPGVKDIFRLKNRIKNWFKGIKGIRMEKENLYVFSPLVLPFPYLRLARRFNRHLILSILEKWTKVTDFTNPIIWIFLPTPLSLDIIYNLNKKIVIYYCIDNFSASSIVAQKIRKSEITLLKKADLVFVTSKELYKYCHTYNEKVYIFPFAVNFKEFEKIRLGENIVPDELKDIRKPLIGYIGGIHKWIDQELIKYVAKTHQEYSFVFIGPIQTNISLLSGLNNVYFLGHKDHRKIPFFVKNFDVCIIPYRITDYTKNVYPTKLNEYLAMGKPVVSMDLPEISSFNIENDNLVLIGKTYEEFASLITGTVNVNDEKLVNRRISSAKENSWDARIAAMFTLIKETIDKKTKEHVDWRETFLRFYRVSRRKMFSIGAIVFSIYILLFYTPLVWFLAEPLKITNSPKKVDCIVVFGGGVGESGKAGQGFEERVKYAVDLYKQEYASNLIFSSGYMYVFKEPLVMKALALSLGVPQDAIILEDKASNTYENIKFSKRILDDNNWDNVILVSSPYHMRRASLVFNKIAADVAVVYSPIPTSLFYSHGIGPKGKKVWKQINMQQIKGILHEYLGIIYYWFKSYI